MARGSKIVVTSDPLGRWLEGTITDTSKPGTVMEVVPATAFVLGWPKWRASSKTAGLPRLFAVLDGDWLQGRVATFAYVANTWGRMYVPLPGDTMNMLYGDIAGTADDIAIGDMFGISAAGKLIANSTYTSPGFEAWEAVTDPIADQLTYVCHNGC